LINAIIQIKKQEEVKLMKAKELKAKEYASQVLSDKTPAPKYVKLQCKEFLDILDSGNKAGKAEKEKDNKDRSKASKYFVDLKRLEMIEQTLKTMIMPRGLRAGDTIYDCSCGYQWLFYTSVL
jgi:hypothetical protein